MLRACADRLATFHIYRFSERSNRLLIDHWHIRYPPIRAASYREAIINVVISGSRGQEQEIEAIVDTGFTGSLSLPPAMIAALGLPFRRRGRALPFGRYGLIGRLRVDGSGRSWWQRLYRRLGVAVISFSEVK
jgi:hypothetical protein